MLTNFTYASMIFSVIFYNFFDFYKEWERFMKNNKDVSIYIVYFEDLKKVGILSDEICNVSVLTIFNISQ